MKILLFNPQTIINVDSYRNIIFYDIQTKNVIFEVISENNATILKDGILVTIAKDTTVKFWSF